MNKKLIGQIGLTLGLVATAVGWRLINHQWMVMPNLELVTAFSLVGAVWLPRRWALVVPVAIMAGSDMLIGNSQIALFTWSAYAVIALAGGWLRRLKQDDGKLIAASTGMGLAAAVWFFAWTNFGVWLLGDGTFYPKTLAGLMESYVMGLPFFRATLISGVVVTPAVFGLMVGLEKLALGRRLRWVGAKA